MESGPQTHHGDDAFGPNAMIIMVAYVDPLGS